jgi:hypothetical protein
MSDNKKAENGVTLLFYTLFHATGSFSEVFFPRPDFFLAISSHSP